MSRKSRKRRKSAPNPPAEPAPTATPRWLARLDERPWLPALTAGLLGVALFAHTLPFPLVDFDDTTYLFEDPRLEAVTLSNLLAIWREPFFANYHPVTTLTYLVDRTVWGTWLPGIRLTHLALYGLGTGLTFFLLRRLTRETLWALLGAALFAAHAAHVEVVAWLAQRKDLVCLIFYLATLLSYARYRSASAERWRWYAATLTFTVLACLSKGYAVVLPAVLLAWDLCFGEVKRRELLDKLPIAAVAGVVVLITVLSQERVEAQLDVGYTTAERLALLLKVYAAYVGKALLPIRSSTLYMVGKTWLPDAVAALGFLLVIGTVAGFFYLRKRQPLVAFGLALFALPLSTVMNVLFTLRVWIADRYLFFPTLGTILILTAVGATVARSGRRRLASAAAVGLLLLYAGLSIARTSVWQGPIELWSDALRKQASLGGSGRVTAAELTSIGRKRADGSISIPGMSQHMITYLAQAYGGAGEEAEARALMALSRPSARGLTTKIREAIAAGDLVRARTLAEELAASGTWNAPHGWEQLATAHGQRGEMDDAREAFLNALALHQKAGRPGAEVMQNLGLVEMNGGNLDAARTWYERARDAAPRDPRALVGLGAVHEKKNDHRAALEAYQAGLALDGKLQPGKSFDFADLDIRAAKVAEKLGEPERAADHYEAVLERMPEHPQRDAIRAAITRLRRPE